MQHTVILLRINRTGGKSLFSIALRQFPPNSVYRIDWLHPEGALSHLKNLSDKEKLKLNLIEGHVGLGVHNLLPQQSAYLTVLRDPVNRIISDYYSIIKHRTHYLHKAVKSKNMSLAEYVRSGITTETDNGQLRRLLGAGGETSPFGGCTRRMVEQAKNDLKRHFIVAGLTEKFDEVLILLKRKLGWKKLRYVRIGVNKNRLRKKDIPKDTLRLIQEHNKFDTELYEYARKIFEEELAREGRWFRVEVMLFKVENALYGGWVCIRKACYAVIAAAGARIRKKTKKMIKGCLALLGLEIHRKSAFPWPDLKTSLRSSLERVLNEGLVPGTVVDVGPGEGTPDLYEVFADARHILIEPRSKYFAYLALLAGRLKSAAYITTPVSGRYSTTTIDEICRARNTRGPYLIKICAGKYEPDILEGARSVLKDTPLVILSFPFAGVFGLDARFQKYIAFMNNYGFYLNDMTCDFHGKAVSGVHMAFKRGKS